MNSFEDIELSAPMQKAIKELGYEKPSPIQIQALPILMGEPTDFIGLAATGTGKTAAFGIPFLEKIDVTKKCVQVLVMCPTRELALQVAGQINLLGKFKGIKALPIYGGSGYGDQIHGLREGMQVVVGTPGRLIDHLDRGTLELDQLQVVVLDEADEMISMGFKEDLEKILQAAPRETSNIWLFSATMSPEVRRVADAYLKKPRQVQVNRTEMLSTTVEQLFYPMRESDKPEILCKIIEAADDFYGLIFCQTKSLVMDLSHYMHGRGYRVETLHGDKSQADRERTLKNFRERKASMLICTDVASRGLDVKDVTHVVNYSIPRELDVYVHRIGRTARSGKAGVAISLVTPSHRGLIGRIEQMTKSKMKEGKIPTRKDIGAKKVAKYLGQFQEQKNFSRAIELLSEDWQTAIANMTSDEIVGRFLGMLSPEIFENAERTKPLQAPVMTDSRGNALPNGGSAESTGQREERYGARRERYGRSDDRRGPRGDDRRGGRRDDDRRGGRDGGRSEYRGSSERPAYAARSDEGARPDRPNRSENRGASRGDRPYGGERSESRGSERSAPAAASPAERSPWGEDDGRKSGGERPPMRTGARPFNRSEEKPQRDDRRGKRADGSEGRRVIPGRDSQGSKSSRFAAKSSHSDSRA